MPTIREHYERDFKRVKFALIVGTVVLMLVLMVRFNDLMRAHGYIVVFALSAVVMGVLFGVIRGRYRCPRCAADIQRLWNREWKQIPLAQRFADSGRHMFWQSWVSCPQCGTKFDEDWDAKG
jgi:hypothetical protein